MFRSEAFAPGDDGVAALCADPLFAEWDALGRRAGAAPFLCPQWTAAWWRAFAESGDRLALWYLRRNGRIAALLPMVQRGRELRIALNYHTPQCGLLAETADAAEALVTALLRMADARQIVMPALDPLLADADICRRAARNAGHTTLTLPHETACYLTLDGDWNAYAAGLGRDANRDVRRRRRRLEEMGRVQFTVHADPESELAPLLDAAFAVEGSGWKQRGGTAIRSDARVEAFYREIAGAAAPEGMLRVCFLRVDGKPVAMQLALEHRDTWYLLKCGYDEQYRQASPGKVLQYECIRHCFDTGMRRIEFCGDRDAHKMRWSPQCRTLERVCLFPPSLPGRLARLRAAARPVLASWYRRLKKGPYRVQAT